MASQLVQRPGFHAATARALTMAGLFVVASLPAFAQFGPRQTVLRESVESWTGTISFKASDSGSTSAGPIPGLGLTYGAEHELTATVHLQRDDKIGGWTGTANGQFKVHESATYTAGCTVIQTIVGHGDLMNDAFGKPLTFSLTLDVGTDTWSLWPSSQYGAGSAAADSVCVGIKTPGQPTPQAISFAPLQSHMGIPVPADTFHLKGSVTIPCDSCLNSTSSSTFHYVFTYDLQPVTKEPELLIDPQGYSSWRPQAGSSEDDIGNTLPVDVHLRLSDGSKPKVGATRIVFDLVKTSREPGVAMNFPAASSARKTVDLKMIKDNNPGTLTIRQGSDGQSAETMPGQYFDYHITLSSYDWGGWTILNATAYLPGGAKVVGHLINDDNMKDVRIPKRRADSYIADAWRDQAEDAAGKDDDDSDNEPEGDGEKGDGLTLYEEYRGFMENSRHIEGKPGKKDLFVRNRIGGDAEGGIFIFTEDSGVEVHKDMQDAELSDDRLINFNHDQGAHKTEQHGVILMTDPAMDGAAAWEHTGLLNPGPPRNTEIVKVQPASKPTEAAGSVPDTSMSAGDRMIAFDRMVAHELMHTVGVWHHGETDYRWGSSDSPHLQSPLNQCFPAGQKPFFSKGSAQFPTFGGKCSDTLRRSTIAGGPAERITILTEDGRDFAQCVYAYTVKGMAANPEEYRTDIQRSNAGYYSGVNHIVGVKGGQDSGDEQCLMRYYFAHFYPKEGATDTFYTRYQCENPYELSDEPIGVGLDSSRTGTGVNDAGHAPQSRYFDANELRGDCAHQIVVNDSAHPKDRSIGQ